MRDTGKEAKPKETLKGAIADVQEKRPVIVDCTASQRQTDRALADSFYSVFCAHIPWDELAPRGGPSKGACLRRWPPGLKDEAQWRGGDPCELLSGDQLGYASQHDYFKA